METKETTLDEIRSLYIKDMVLMNDIVEVEPEFLSVEDPFEYQKFIPELRIPVDVHRYYATNLNCSQVEFLVKKYHLLFKLSSTLDTFFLCIDQPGSTYTDVVIKEYND